MPYRNHFRITNLPDAATLRDVFARIEELLGAYAAGARENLAAEGTASNVVSATSRFK